MKLGDLNVSALACEGSMKTVTGTPYYCPPEVWTNKAYTPKCDIWSLGCVMYELTALKPPFVAKNIKDLQKKVTKGEYSPIPDHFSKNLEELIGACLNVNPLTRLGASELLLHKSFCDLTNEK